MKTRKHNLCFLYCFLLFFICTGTRFASAQKDTLRLSLQQAIDLALKENRSVRIADLEISKTGFLIKETLGSFYPKFDISGQYIRNLQKPVIFLPEGSPFGTVLRLGSDNSYTSMLSANVPVYSGALFAALRMARKGMDLAVEMHRGTKITSAGDVKKAYYNALLAREALKVLNQAWVNAKRNTENIRNMHTHGMVAEYDLIRASVQSDNLQPQAEQAKDNYILLTDILKTAIGIPAGQPLLLTDSLGAGTGENIPPPAAEATLANNSILKQTDFQLSLAAEQVNLNRAGRYPSLAAFGNYQVQSQANDYAFGKYRWVNTSLAGFQLKIPLFAGFTIDHKIKQSEIAARELALRKEMLSESLVVQLNAASRKAVLAKSRMETQEKTIGLAARGLEIAHARYKAGTGTLMELNDAELALMQAQLNYLQAVYDLKMAVVEYEMLTGKGY